MGDYVIRATNQSIPGITDVRLVPDPSLHLEYFTKTAPKLAESLFDRPTTLVTIDQPLLITCDEPVILRTAGDASHGEHLPTCFASEGRRRRRRRLTRVERNLEQLQHGDTVHAYPTRPRVHQAAEVAIHFTSPSLAPGARSARRCPRTSSTTPARQWSVRCT
jgi:hypothetical protein